MCRLLILRSGAPARYLLKSPVHLCMSFTWCRAAALALSSSCLPLPRHTAPIAPRRQRGVSHALQCHPSVAAPPCAALHDAAWGGYRRARAERESQRGSRWRLRVTAPERSVSASVPRWRANYFAVAAYRMLAICCMLEGRGPVIRPNRLLRIGREHCEN